MIDDGLSTQSSKEQSNLERKIAGYFYSEYTNLTLSEFDEELVLERELHVRYLQKGLKELPGGFVSLDASRPWLCYWICHSLALLEAPVAYSSGSPSGADVVEFLKRCQDERGGYGGGPQQLPHLAPTYAAVACLVTLGGQEALLSINRNSLFAFLKRMCIPAAQGGGMSMHEGGEVDVRGCYTALAAAHMTGLDKQELVQRCDMLNFLQRCQTYEGGMGGEPDNEAHGGYSFCGLAAAILAGRPAVLDIPRLLHWLVHRQGVLEGGFMGRTNKLVDGCYSFWQGAVFPLIRRVANTYAVQVGVSRGLPPATQGGDEQHISVHPLHLPDTLVMGHVDQAQLFLSVAQAKAARLRQRVEDMDGTVDAADYVDTTREVEEAVDRAEEAADIAPCAAVLLCPDEQQTHPSGPACGIQEWVETNHLFNCEALQLWILKCCQGAKGGLKDKPGKPPDYYHSCYCLSGLAACQQYSGTVVGPEENQLADVDPLCNVVMDKLSQALEFFTKDA